MTSQVIQVPVSAISFTHCSISHEFRNGKHRGIPISTLVEDLKSGRVQVGADFLKLDVVEHDGHILSLRNRRLWCLKEYARELGSDIVIPVKLWPLREGVQILPEGCDIVRKFRHSYTSGGLAAYVRVRSPSRSMSRSVSPSRNRHSSNHGGRSSSPSRRAAEPLVFLSAEIDGYSRCKEPLSKWLKDGRRCAVVCGEDVQPEDYSFETLCAQCAARTLEEEAKQEKRRSSSYLDIDMFSLLGGGIEQRGKIVFSPPVSANDMAAVFGLRSAGSPDGDATIYINGLMFGILGGAFREIEKAIPGIRAESKSGTGGFLNRVTRHAGNSYCMVSGPAKEALATVETLCEGKLSMLFGALGSEAATMSLPSPDGPTVLAAMQSPLEIMLDYTADMKVQRLVLMTPHLSNLLLFAKGVLHGPKPSSLLSSNLKCMKLTFGVSQSAQERHRGYMSSQTAEVCRDFQRGLCTYGERCRFRHAERNGNLLSLNSLAGFRHGPRRSRRDVDDFDLGFF